MLRRKRGNSDIAAAFFRFMRKSPDKPIPPAAATARTCKIRDDLMPGVSILETGSPGFASSWPGDGSRSGFVHR